MQIRPSALIGVLVKHSHPLNIINTADQHRLEVIYPKSRAQTSHSTILRMLGAIQCLQLHMSTAV